MRLAAGYSHELYVRSASLQHEPIALKASGGWLVPRAIPETDWLDATAPYPLLACLDWQGLEADLAALDDGLVSVLAIPDPFGTHDPALLERCFPDLCQPFKPHFVTDLGQALANFAPAHHLRNVRYARSRLVVERAADPRAWHAEWCDLYEHLVARHGITGSAAFSRAAFALQLATPGLVAFRARDEAGTQGMVLWYVMGNVAYYHLAAYSPGGYAAKASYALFAEAIAVLRDEVRWLALGGAAGVNASAGQGLARFKQGFATATRQAFLCGRIGRRDLYKRLSAPKTPTAYFPAYRGEG